jgi:hypothetical protein
MRRSTHFWIQTLAVLRRLWAVVLVTSMAFITCPSLASAATSNSSINDAIKWALNQNHLSIDDQECLAFVTQAYAQGGVALGTVGNGNGAAQYWASNPKGFVEHPGNTNPPVGALVFWGPTPDPYANPYGHVGIYLGNDTVISSASWPESSAGTEVHEFSFTGRNAASDGVAPFTAGFYPYLGWIAPAVSSSGTGPSKGSTQPTLGVDWAHWITGFNQVRPSHLKFGLDGYSSLSGIKWKSWGGATATGTAIGWYVPANKSNGDGKDERVSVVAFDLSACGSQRAYAGLVWYFPQQHQTEERSPYWDTCIGDIVQQGCNPVALASVAGRYVRSNNLFPGYKFELTSSYCRGPFAVTGFQISPAPTDGFSSSVFVYKRSGSTWVVMNNQLFEFQSLPGMSAALLTSLTTTMSTYWPLAYQVPVPT